MPMPRSVTKVTRDGVTYVSNVDRAQYTIEELSRAALKDVAKLITKRLRPKLNRQSGRLRKNTQYWVRRRETDLQIGFKPGGFYGMYQELGSSKVPKQGHLKNTVMENIDQIRIIQGKYLSAIEDENRALGLIDESEELSDD